MTEVSFSHTGVSGEITIPGSKSYTQRYILLSAFSEIPLTLANVSGSGDEVAAIRIAESTGATVTHEGSTLKIYPHFNCPPVIDAEESATSLRIALALLSARRCSSEVHVRESLALRNSRPLISELENHGVIITETDHGFRLNASPFVPGDMTVTGALSSQFTTACLLLQSMIGGDSRRVLVRDEPVSQGYVDITVECIRNLGIQVTRDDETFSLSGTLKTPINAVSAETDMSSLSFFLTLGVLASEAGITIRDVNSSGKQPDHAYVSILQQAGFNVSADWKRGLISTKKGPGGHITVDADFTPDLCIPASVLGIFSPAGVTILNPGRLSGKESDRKQSIVELGQAFGASVTESGDRLEILPADNPALPDRIEFRDHRMVMAAALAAITSSSGTVVGDTESVKKSLPSFQEILRKIGIKVNVV